LNFESSASGILQLKEEEEEEEEEEDEEDPQIQDNKEVVNLVASRLPHDDEFPAIYVILALATFGSDVLPR
jgi:hypothetical protein